MLISLKYKRHSKDNYRWLSLVECDYCHKQRLIDKGHVVKGSGIKFCNRCNIKARKTSKKYFLQHYIDFGKSINLEFLNNHDPKNNYEKCKWKCLKCNYIFNRSWKDLHVSNYTCEDHERLSKCNWILHPKFANKEEKHKRKKCVSIVYSLISRTLKYKNEKSYLAILGYTFDDLKKHIESLWEPWMNWNNYGKYSFREKRWQIDHIKPISDFFNENIHDPKIINALSNLRPLEALANVSRNSVKLL